MRPINSLSSRALSLNIVSLYRMNHPIKRFKPDDLDRCRTNKNSKYDLYIGQPSGESSSLPNLAQQFALQNYGDGVKSEWKGDDAKSNGKDSKNDLDDKNSTSENLFTSEGLQPSYADLNKIFDNSDDNSNDDHVS